MCMEMCCSNLRLERLHVSRVGPTKLCSFDGDLGAGILVLRRVSRASCFNIVLSLSRRGSMKESVSPASAKTSQVTASLADQC